MQEHARKTFVQDAWQTPRNARTLAAYMALQNREIGERISALRHARGNPPQEIVAQRLEVAYRSYQSWEAGDTKPSWRNLTKLAKYYGVTEEYILIGEMVDDVLEPTQLDRIERKLDEILKRLPPEVEEPPAADRPDHPPEPPPSVQPKEPDGSPSEEGQDEPETGQEGGGPGAA